MRRESESPGRVSAVRRGWATISVRTKCTLLLFYASSVGACVAVGLWRPSLNILVPPFVLVLWCTYRIPTLLVQRGRADSRTAPDEQSSSQSAMPASRRKRARSELGTAPRRKRSGGESESRKEELPHSWSWGPAVREGRMSKFARQLAWMVAAFLSLGLTAQFASRDVACLGAQKGVRATIAALVIGVPVGIGTITLMLLATSLMGPMSSLTYVRQATKRTGEFAALGAIYGSMTGAVASGAEMTSLSGRPACQVDLLQTIGNGATWGTMVGFAAALFV